jgi:hypothetical protein
LVITDINFKHNFYDILPSRLSPDVSEIIRDSEEDQDVGGWITLGWILERWDGVTGLVWLRIGKGGELLRIRY